MCICCLRDWSRSGGSYGNNTREISCPAPGRPERAARGTSSPDNKSRGCCCRNSRPTVINPDYKQRVLMHRHQGWNVRHGLCHIYMRYVYIWVVYSFCLFCCLFIIVTWWYMWCIVWQVAIKKKKKACLVTLWLFIISCHSLYKTTLGSLCSWKPAWYLKKHPNSMCLKPFVKICIFVVIQIFWSLRKYREQ